jgi:hypothetical protein
MFRIIYFAMQENFFKTENIDDLIKLKEAEITKIPDELKREKETNQELNKKVPGSYGESKSTTSIGYAEDCMTDQKVHLAIVIDENDRPVSFITAGDIKRCLMSS